MFQKMEHRTSCSVKFRKLTFTSEHEKVAKKLNPTNLWISKTCSGTSGPKVRDKKWWRHYGVIAILTGSTTFQLAHIVSCGMIQMLNYVTSSGNIVYHLTWRVGSRLQESNSNGNYKLSYHEYQLSFVLQTVPNKLISRQLNAI